MLLYCTKGKPYLKLNDGMSDVNARNPLKCYDNPFIKKEESINGKIVAECDFEVEKIYRDFIDGKRNGLWERYEYFKTDNFYEKELYEKSCLTYQEMAKYFDDKDNKIVGYAIHIKNLNIFDEPKELSYYYTRNADKLKSAPQNMCYCNEWLFNVEKIKENNGR